MHRPVVRTPIVVSGCSPAHGRREFLSATGGSLSTARRTLRKAFTLIEVLVAMVVTLILMGIVVTIFGQISTGVSNSHATMDMTDQLRTAKNRLQVDLAGVTAQMLPPRRPEFGEGYFEIIDGPVGKLLPNTAWVYDENYNPNQPTTAPVNVASLHFDTTVGDNDDMLMFTTRTTGEPFNGRIRMWNPVTGVNSSIDSSLQSEVAEVAWFLRGTTLYRRQLLVRPDVNSVNGQGLMLAPPLNISAIPYYGTLSTPSQATNFYALNDLSVRPAGALSGSLAFDLSPTPPNYFIAANSLGDLTNRENRFFHRALIVNYNLGAPSNSPYGWPHDVRSWGVFYSANPYGYAANSGTPTLGRLGLPTLTEMANPIFPLPGGADPTALQQGLTIFNTALPSPQHQGDSSGNVATDPNLKNQFEFDAWVQPNPWEQIDPATGTLNAFATTATTNTRFADDIILTNVLSFDVRVWDPTAWTIALTDNNGTGNTATYSPGDPGYPQAVCYYATNYTGYSYALVSQGAYVDLNYYASIINFAAANSINLTGSYQQLFTGVLVSGTVTIPPLFQCPVQSPTAAQLSTFLQYGTLPAPALTSNTSFFGPGDARSMLDAYQRNPSTLAYLPSGVPFNPAAAIYDTGSWNYEHDGIDQDGTNFLNTAGNPVTDQGTNGIDDNGDGLVDDPAELEAPPPYTAPLRGIQVKIRCFDPDSKQIREVTIIQEFVSE
jgi:prepilin-type N-terminal cleavage/methylation domain-containing protein